MQKEELDFVLDFHGEVFPREQYANPAFTTVVWKVVRGSKISLLRVK